MRRGMGRAAMHGCGGDDEEQPKTAAAGTLKSSHTRLLRGQFYLGLVGRGL